VKSSGKRTRGPNQGTPWSRSLADDVSVLRLPLDMHDPRVRDRVEAMFWTGYQIRRAIQRQARSACVAYQAATHERSSDPAAVRKRLRLSRSDLEHAAYGHLDAAPHLRRDITKALAMHLADGVWRSVERHLFSDRSGKRQGLLHIGRWHEMNRLPGRARSHTTERKWETFRLHGSLAGHRAAYTDRDGAFVQPRRLRSITNEDWWRYDGPLAIVFSGLADGTLVVPVRLPTAPCNQPILDHHLGDPSKWHKVDLVRRRDPNTPGGWRYEAHLMLLSSPYASRSTIERRAQAAIATSDRRVGIDVNVSNVTIASHDAGLALKLSRVERELTQKVTDHKRRRRERIRQRALDRSRRAMNRAQYRLSRRQEKRAQRRAAAGIPEVDVIPAGPRLVRSNGLPLQSFRGDRLSARYGRLRAEAVAEAAGASQFRRDRARRISGDLIASHGYQLVIEDVSIAAWSTRWGRSVAAFSPSLLVAALDREARAVAKMARGDGGVEWASTATTALSQNCPCGQRVTKQLSDRLHDCLRCGLCGDRDAVSAVLASFVVLTDRDDPASARVDYTASHQALGSIRRALHNSSLGWQDTLSESTGLSARDGSSIAWWTPTPDAVARRNVGMATCSTLNETSWRWTTSERARRRTHLSRNYDLRGPYSGPTLSASTSLRGGARRRRTRAP
jgi:hypothetical protein